MAQADRAMSVGYRTPSALHGLHVSSRIPALHVATVEVTDARSLRARPGIRFVRALVPRTRAEAAVPVPSAAAEWQTAATHLDQVPVAVLDGAAAVTIAVVDTGADLSSPALAARHPVTYNVTNGSTDVDDKVGHGTFVASLAAGLRRPGATDGRPGEPRRDVLGRRRGGRASSGPSTTAHASST